MIAKTVEKTEIKTIKIEGKSYDITSLTELGTNIISNIQKVEEIISRKQLELGVVNLAKAKLIEDLIKEANNFKEVQTS